MPTIRQSLERLDPSASDHPFLAFERLIPDSQAEGDGKRRHQEQALQRPIPEQLMTAYRAGFRRRYQALMHFDGAQAGAVTRCFQVKVDGRLATGLGNASVLMNGLALNHTYGLPYLAGTGLKGMASTMAHLGLSDPAWARGVLKDGKWSGQGADHKCLFGTMDPGAEDTSAGLVIFHDAWWDMEPEDQPETHLPFQPDVMTPHHQQYNLDGADWPNDWESPTPVPFLTVRGTFRLALTGPPAWVEAAFEILKAAFQHIGFGAKTQIGYGRGELETFESPEEKAERAEQARRQQAELAEATRLDQEAQERKRLEERQATSTSQDGKLLVTDPGRGLYRLKIGASGEYTLEDLQRETLKGLAGQDWDEIAKDAKKRKERGVRVRVGFCLEAGQPFLLSLAAPIPQP